LLEAGPTFFWEENGRFVKSAGEISPPPPEKGKSANVIWGKKYEKVKRKRGECKRKRKKEERKRKKEKGERK
jgi:hypothetical protein